MGENVSPTRVGTREVGIKVGVPVVGPRDGALLLGLTLIGLKLVGVPVVGVAVGEKV